MRNTLQLNMIKSFKHKGLKKFFEKGDFSGFQPKHEKKLKFPLQRFILQQLLKTWIYQDITYIG